MNMKTRPILRMEPTAAVDAAICSEDLSVMKPPSKGPITIPTPYETPRRPIADARSIRIKEWKKISQNNYT